MIPLFADLPADEHQPAAQKPPVSPNPRITSLDVLRGIAVLGGLLVSIWVFGGFSFNKQLQLLHNPHGKSYTLYALVSIFFEGKMLGLISLVFGAGILLFLRSGKGDAKTSRDDLFIRRQMWLVAFGLLNALVFLWSGDVLFHLGILGILLFAFARLSSKGLLAASMVALAIFCGKNYWQFSDDQKAYSKYLAVVATEKKIKQDSITKAKEAKPVASVADTAKKSSAAALKPDTLTAKQKQEKSAWEGLVKNKKFDPKKDDNDIKQMRQTSYSDVYDHLLQRTQGREAQWTYRTGVWDISSMMLLGMCLFKIGFFTRRLTAARYAIIALVGLAIGIGLAYLRLYLHQLSVADYEKFIKQFPAPHNFLVPLEKAFMVLGYAGIVMLALQVRLFKPFLSLLSAVGQLALSNYLLQSIFCTLFFAGFSMGYFGRLELYQLYLLVAEIWIVQAVCSVIYLKYYAVGPAEWLWQSLTAGKFQPSPWKKKPADPTPAIA